MPLQWFSTRSKTMDWPSWRLTYWYEPVPAGRFSNPSSPSLIPLRLAHHPQVTTAREGIRQGGGWALHAEDDLVVIDDLHLFHVPPDAHERRDGLLRSMSAWECTTSLAVNSPYPKWKGTPLRRNNVHSFISGLASHFSARRGMNSPVLGSRSSKVSR